MFKHCKENIPTKFKILTSYRRQSVMNTALHFSRRGGPGGQLALSTSSKASYKGFPHAAQPLTYTKNQDKMSQFVPTPSFTGSY